MEEDKELEYALLISNAHKSVVEESRQLRETVRALLANVHHHLEAEERTRVENELLKTS